MCVSGVRVEDGSYGIPEAFIYMSHNNIYRLLRTLVKNTNITEKVMGIII